MAWVQIGVVEKMTKEELKTEWPSHVPNIKNAYELVNSHFMHVKPEQFGEKADTNLVECAMCLNMAVFYMDKYLEDKK